RLQPGRGVRGRPGELPVLHLLSPGPLRLTLPLAVGVDEGVGEDPEQPCLQVRAGLELLERGVGLGEGLLYQVFGVRRVSGHPHTGCVDLIQVRQRHALESLASLFECLRYRTHLLRCLHPRPATDAIWAGEYIARPGSAEGSYRSTVIQR